MQTLYRHITNCSTGGKIVLSTTRKATFALMLKMGAAKTPGLNNTFTQISHVKFRKIARLGSRSQHFGGWYFDLKR